MRWDMEILSPSSYFSNSSWLVEESRSITRWTAAENKAFENALAVFDENTPDRWAKVAAMVPGKTVGDVIRQYKELEDDVSSIEAGLIPLPGYTTTSDSSSSAFTLEWGGGHGYHEGLIKQSFAAGMRKTPAGRPTEQERKKGVPWTEEEHKLFLMGLKKYGKGDWRNISRNFVVTRTPTQVASHAQKYFIRQLSGGKDKRRASIHDITTVNLNENQSHSSPENNIKPISSTVEPSSVLVQKSIEKLPFQWDQSDNNETVMGFGSTACHGNNVFVDYGMNNSNYGPKMMQRGGGGVMHDSYMGIQNMVFQMQSGIHYPNA